MTNLFPSSLTTSLALATSRYFGLVGISNLFLDWEPGIPEECVASEHIVAGIKYGIATRELLLRLYTNKRISERVTSKDYLNKLLHN